MPRRLRLTLSEQNATMRNNGKRSSGPSMTKWEYELRNCFWHTRSGMLNLYHFKPKEIAVHNDWSVNGYWEESKPNVSSRMESTDLPFMAPESLCRDCLIQRKVIYFHCGNLQLYPEIHWNSNESKLISLGEKVPIISLFRTQKTIFHTNIDAKLISQSKYMKKVFIIR